MSVVQKVMQLPTVCRMIALRACLRIPYAITFLAYAGGIFDMALREAYAGTFVTFIICPHRKCLREPFFPLARNHTRPSWSFRFRRRWWGAGRFCQPFVNCILAFTSISVIQFPCSPPSASSDTQGLSGWHCGQPVGNSRLRLRGPYAHLTRISETFSFNFQWFILGPALIWPYVRNLTRHTIQ